jgi:hypothetical protein
MFRAILEQAIERSKRIRTSKPFRKDLIRRRGLPRRAILLEPVG